jgi:hypothetical protein
MASHTGYNSSVITPITHFSTTSPSIESGVENNFVGRATLIERELFGPRTDVTPTGMPLNTHDGFLTLDFVDLWYNRIHIIPSRINAGNLASRQVRSIEIWNGFSTSQTITAVTSTDEEDNSLDITTPEVYTALQSRFHLLTIGTGGPPSFDGFFTITFATLGDFFLFVSGRRVLTVPFAHNWDDQQGSAIIERLTWRTNVLEAINGVEQAIMMRQYPRRTLQYSYLLASTGTNAPHVRALFHALMSGWQSRLFAVPIWTDATRLSVAAAAGQPVITVPTGFFDYDPGNYIMLWQDQDNYELLQIDSMDSGTVTATVNLANTWPALRTVVMPARLGYITPQMQGAKETVDLDIVPITFELLVNAFSVNRIVAGARTTYRGLHVLLQKNFYNDTHAFEINRPVERFDANIGYFSQDAINPAPHTKNEFAWLCANHQGSSDLFAWLDSRRGRYGAFWYPTWAHDFELAQDIGSTDASIVVNNIGYSALYVQDGAPIASRRDIMLQTVSGSRFFKRIIDAGDNGDGTETLSLDSTFGVVIPVNAIDRISFLIPSRQDADAVEIAWQTGNVSLAQFATADLLDGGI